MSQKIVFGLTLSVAQNIKEEVEQEILHKIPDIQSVCRYRREGIYQYVKQQEDVLIIMEEFLQGRDSYPMEELQQLTDLGNNRVIFLLDRSHAGSDYIKALYCCGIYDGLYLDEAVPREIMKLVWQGRTTEQARKYYGIQTLRDAEKSENFVNEECLGLYMEYLEDETENKEFGEKYRFVSTRLGEEENRVLAANLSKETAMQLRGNEVFEFFKDTNKKKRSLFSWKRKAEKPPKTDMPKEKSEDNTVIVPVSILVQEDKCLEEDEIFHAMDRFWAMEDKDLDNSEPEDLRLLFGGYLKAIDG